jgi:biopolymer transport protein ExbD
MHLGSPITRKKARLEIIPLIDVMFFLLAAFMMVSLAMIHLQSLKMNLPTAALRQSAEKPNVVNLTVDQSGDAFVEEDKNKIRKTLPDLETFLTNRFSMDSNVSVYITGHPKATHGQMVSVLDVVRESGISKVSFNISLPDETPKR